jgi:regulator of sigma E protease
MFLTIIIFIIVLAALIFVHELGHFIAARSFGIRVDEFALGFGPRLFSWKLKNGGFWGETTYAVNAIPFGGFVKIFGENPDDESMTGADSARSFVNAARWKQAVVLVSGVLGNFVFAWLLIVIALSIGAAASPTDYPQYANRMTDERIMIGAVSPGSPAEKAGIKEGDVILGLSSASILPVKNITIDAIQTDIASSSGAPFVLSILRNGKDISVTAYAEKNVIQGEPDKYAFGISMDYAATLKLPWYTATYESVRFNIYLVQEVYGVIGGLFQGQVSVSDLAGPVYIAQKTGEAAQAGFSSLLVFVGLISVNLGVMNLLPIPALDGGRLLFVIIEAVRRRPIKASIANGLNLTGFVLLMILMVFVTYHDIVRTIMQFYHH